MPPLLEFDAVTRRYRRVDEPAVNGVSFAVESGELVGMVGQSGSGKTTLLRLVAGLETPDEGSIAIDGRPVAGPGAWVPPEKRHVGFIFQDAGLFPHLTAGKNIAYGLSREQRREGIEPWLELVGLGGMAKRYPHQLSGGERQRLAVARALAPGPRILLMDEPFSNLDPSLRHRLRSEIAELLRAHSTTALLVTHDTDDALAISDRIVVVRDGQIEQDGEPREVYHEPVSAYAARLFGPVNEMAGQGPTRWVRPEAMELRSEDSDDGVPARVLHVVDDGREWMATVQAEGEQPWRVPLNGSPPPAAGEHVRVFWNKV